MPLKPLPPFRHKVRFAMPFWIIKGALLSLCVGTVPEKSSIGTEDASSARARLRLLIFTTVSPAHRFGSRRVRKSQKQLRRERERLSRETSFIPDRTESH